MTKEDLIRILEQIPGNPEVVLCDYRKVVRHADSDGTTEGVYSEFDVALEDLLDNEEREYLKETHDVEFEPYISISFTNNDYDNDGNCVIEN